MIVILHNIRSAHNVGSIFRTSDAAGIEKIYLSGFTPSPVNKVGNPMIRVTKVSLGAEDYVEWEKVDSTLDLIKELKKEKYNIYSVEQHKKSENLINVKIKNRDKIALVMGNEVEGLPKEILDESDKIIEIPMKGKKKSLNVSVAFGVAAYCLNVINKNDK